MDLPQSVKDVLSNVQTMLERKSTRVDEMGVRRRALAGDTEAKAQVRLWDSEDRARPFPRVMPDGSDVKTLEDVAALMGTTTAVAAHYVSEQKGLPVDLYRAATKALHRGEQDDHNSSGIMIALVFEPEAARAIAARGVIKEDEIHLTLGYYGSIAPSDAPEEDFLLGHLKRMGQNFSPFTINLNGITRFSSEDGPDAVVVNADAPELEALRSYLREETTIKSEHGFTPHVTIGYVDADGAVPVKRFKPIRVRAEKIMLAYGDRQHIVPLSKPDIREEKAMEVKSPSNLVNHATRELALMGMTVDSEDEMNAAMARAVLGIVEKFATQGHSGMSAGYALGTLERLLAFKPLTPLTDNPEEWTEVAEGLWQSVRDSEAFSKDGGKTYTLNSERSRRRISKPHGEKADFSAEVKGLIRRVRTAAGMRRYGQPIGSIIVRDAIGNLPDSKPGTDKPAARKPSAPKPLADRRSGGAASEKTLRALFKPGVDLPPTAYEVLGKQANLDSIERLKKPNAVDVLNRESTWEDFSDPENDYREFEMTTSDGLTRAVARVSNTGQVGVKYYDAEIQDALPEDIALRPFHASQTYIFGDVDAGLSRLRDLMAIHISTNREIQAWARNQPILARIERESTNLKDVYEGTYGVDYFYDDDENTEVLPKAKRKANAAAKREELGIRFMVSSSRPSLETEELVNAIAESMEKIIPGYTNAMNEYQVKRSRGAIAWNGYKPDYEGGLSVHIGLNAEYYGTSELAPQRIYDQKTQAVDRAWSATEDLRVLAEDWGKDPAEMAAMYTLVHEHGHTLARALFGESWIDRKMGNPDRETAPQFKDTLNGILKKYEIFSPNSTALNQTDLSENASRFQLNKNSIMRSRALMAVSEYGSTNLHELMAETWASYMLDERPTQFVQELGDYIRNASIDWFGKAANNA